MKLLPALRVTALAALVVGACTPGLGGEAGGSPEDAGGPTEDVGGDAGDAATSDGNLLGDATSDVSDAAGDASDAGGLVDASDGGGLVDAGDLDASLGPPGPSYTWNGSFDLPNGVCSIHGWCVVERGPYPTGFADVWSPGWPGHVWATKATTGNAVLRYDGAWRGLIGLPDASKLGAIAGTGPNDVWIGKLHWDGATLSENPKPPPGSTPWFSSATDGWSVGASAWHWDGATWTAFPTGTVKTLSTVYGFAPNDVWAVGDQELRHWDGVAWTAPPVPLPGGAGLTPAKLGGSSSSNLWLTDGGGIYRFNGAAWSKVASPAGAPLAIGSGPTTSIMFASNRYTWNGSIFTADVVSPCTGAGQGCGTCVGAWLSPLDAIVAAGQAGNASPGCPVTVRASSAGPVQRIGGFGAGSLYTWLYETPTESVKVKSTGASTASSRAVSGKAGVGTWTVGTTDVGGGYASGPAGYFVFGGAPNSEVGITSSTAAWLLTTNGPAASSSAAFFDGNAWTTFPGPPIGNGTTTPRGSVWGASATDAWAVSPEGCWHWDGIAWSSIATCGSGAKVWGTAANDVWVFGANGTVKRWDGISWTQRSGPTFAASALSAGGFSVSAWNDVWAAARDVYHWNGYVWEQSVTGWSGAYAQAISVNGGYGRVAFNDGTEMVRKP